MSTDFRVDRVDELRVPCGMNSIVYVGPSEIAARTEFAKAKVGLDTWGKPNDTYGVILSRWSVAEGDYVILDQKFYD